MEQATVRGGDGVASVEPTKERRQLSRLRGAAWGTVVIPRAGPGEAVQRRVQGVVLGMGEEEAQGAAHGGDSLGCCGARRQVEGLASGQLEEGQEHL